MDRSTIPVFKPKTRTPPPMLEPGEREHRRVVIVGAGPIGLALALDLGLRGHEVTVLTKLDFIAHGSKAICFAKQSLDIFDGLGVGERVMEKGVVWNVGKVFRGGQSEPIYEFDMLPVKGQKNPGFVNIQQYHVEDYLVDAIDACPDVELRWGHAVTGVDASPGHNVLEVDTGKGSYSIEADYVLACDGSRSPVRTALGLDFEGRVFEDHFLIADVRFRQQRPSERWFWFDPPFNRGQTALLHKQPDNVWRLDFQLGQHADCEAALEPGNVARLVEGMLGADVDYELEWLTVYTFHCRRMGRFVHDKVIFVGDSAHLVSPFGARGCNGGLADVANLAWKLDWVLRGRASGSLLESYNSERIEGADENILNSSRSTDFLTPKDRRSQAFRDAVLELAREYSFARPFVNSGRLSTPTPYHASPLSTPDTDDWQGGVAPGYPALDAPIDRAGAGWVLTSLGRDFAVLHFGESPPETRLPVIHLPPEGAAAERYDALDGGTYLIRPDQVVAARWKSPRSDELADAYRRASGNTP